MAQWLKALVTLSKDPFWFPAPTWWFITICNSSSRDTIPCSGLHRHQAHVWYTDIHANKTSKHKK